MQSERWRSCTDIFHSAIERPPDERAAFLDESCGVDDTLRRKVELLLKYHEQSGDFIATSAFQISPELLLDDPDALIGQRLGHYRIESVLGIGGMGVVYLAEDERLGRKVGLKLLPRSLVADEAQLERLKREARTASALNHPNIVTIHEIAKADGIHYLATEFIEGITLRERMTQGPIPPDEAAEIAQQIASALSIAHAAGIVHRDIKPENVMLRPDGYVKVLDFGIAKFTQPETTLGATQVTTQQGMILGTTRYMSPEQARGLAVDARTDIWSLGVVLYEMLAGQPPFQGATPTDLIIAIADREPAPLANCAPGMPIQLERIVKKALAKDREERHQTAKYLLSDLKSGTHDFETRWVIPAPRKRILVAAAILALLIVAGLFSARFVRRSSPPVSQPEIKSLAVLPLENLSGDATQEYFADGLTDALIGDLANIAALRVISRTSTMHYKGTKKSLPQIAQELQVDAVVEGTVQRSNERIRIRAQLIHAATDRHLWVQTYERNLADVFALQSEIAKTIANQLRARLSPKEEALMQQKPTNDMVAYDLYLRATEIWRSNSASAGGGGVEELKREIHLLEEVINRDPGFMAALCLLARAHLALHWDRTDTGGSHLDLAKKALESAAQLRPDAGEVHLTRALYYYYGSRDYVPALSELVLARQSLPNDAEIPFYAAAIERRQDKWSDSTRHIEEALLLDPRNLQIVELTVSNYMLLRRYADAARILDDALAWKPNDFGLAFRRASVETEWKGDLRRSKIVVSGDLAKNADPNDLLNARLQLALRERDYLAARQILKSPGGVEYDDDGFFAPREWYQAIVARGLGETEVANAAFQAAHARAAVAVRERPEDAKALMALAQIDAALGRKEDAIREGQRATELLPIERDVLVGNVLLLKLAEIDTAAGEIERALDILEKAVSKPGRLNYGSLKLDEGWDPLRRHPRFGKIVASLAPNEVLPPAK